MFITAKTRVKPAYENTTIGRYLLTFSAISIISTISFMRSALVSSTTNHWSKNDIKVINLSTNSWFEGECTIYHGTNLDLFIALFTASLTSLTTYSSIPRMHLAANLGLKLLLRLQNANESSSETIL
jgi:hypothetical protein